MSKKKLIRKIPCPRHSGYYSVIAFGWRKHCRRCEKECNEYMAKMTKEMNEYIDKKFMEIGEKMKKESEDTE